MRCREYAISVVSVAVLGCADIADSDDDDDVVASTHVPDAEIRYRTKHVDISTMSAAPVCAGTRERIDQHVEAVLADLELKLDRRLRMYLFHPGDDLRGWCPQTAVGCYHASTDTIMTYATAIPHEIVHALEPGRSWWQEGLPYSYSTIPSEPLPPNRWSPSIAGSGHLTRWLIDTFGPEAYLQLFTGSPPGASQVEIEAQVREVFGAELPTLLDEYAATAPWQYPSRWSCRGASGTSAQPWVDGFWRVSARLDCDAATTFNDDDLQAMHMIARLSVTIPADGKYMFIADQAEASFRLWPCSPELVAKPYVGAPIWEHVFHPALPAPHLAAGDYVLEVGVPLGAPLDLKIQGYVPIEDSPQP